MKHSYSDLNVVFLHRWIPFWPLVNLVSNGSRPPLEFSGLVSGGRLAGLVSSALLNSSSPVSSFSCERAEVIHYEHAFSALLSVLGLFVAMVACSWKLDDRLRDCMTLRNAGKESRAGVEQSWVDSAVYSLLALLLGFRLRQRDGALRETEQRSS